MTITPIAPADVPTFETVIAPEYGLVEVDLYRNIHKGIRAELFAVTANAGSLDPTEYADRAAFTTHVVSLAGVLESHAHHEDEAIDPLLEEHFPGLAERVRADHDTLERRFGGIVELAEGFVGVDASEQRRLAQLLHLELAGFASSYLLHQDLEEREIMPVLERRLGPAAMLEVHAAIVGSIPPDELARTLAFMLPAMNVFDRLEMLGGMQATAPAPAFEAVVGLARSVLRPDDFAAVARRLAIA